MKPDSVLTRTPEGEEILHGYEKNISSNQRHALLVVDGKATVADLETKAFWVSDLMSTLEELHAMGLVRDEASTTGSGTGQPGGAGGSLKDQLAAVARELLGSNADRIVNKIEETDGTAGALEQALLTCKKIIKLTINEELADTFLQRGRKVIGK